MIFSTFDEPLATVFAFQADPVPVPAASSLTFRKKPSHRRSPKRSRPVADVDELISDSKKKRRLRLTLITSRLSKPYSTPATHIVDPGTSKIAVWAKQKHLTSQVLRKAAIMNRVRRKTLERKDSGISVGEDARREAREAVFEEMRAGGEAVGLGPNAVAPPVRDTGWSNSVPPSPLGLSNYDALDDEDDWYESYQDDEEEDNGTEWSFGPPSSTKSKRGEKGMRDEEDGHESDAKSERSYYSDFNFFEAKPPRSEDEEAVDNDPFALEILPVDIAKERRPPSPPEGKFLELMKEKQRQREIQSEFLHLP